MKLNKVFKATALSVLGASVMFGAVGCSSNEQSTPTSGVEETKPVETTDDQPVETDEKQESVSFSIFQFKVEIQEALEKAIARYEELNPHVSITLETVGGGSDYGAALRAKFQSGQEPTIFNIGGPQDVEDWIHTLEDLSDQPWVSLAGGTTGAVTVDGAVYGMPYNVEGYGLVYNKAIFEAAGIDTSLIVDQASMDVAFAELDAQIKAGELADQFPLLEAVIELPGQEKWVTGLHASNIFINQEFETGVDAYNAESIDFVAADAFKDYMDMQIKYSPNADNPERINVVDYSTQVGQGLAIERVAVIQQGNWVYGDVASIDQEVADNLGFLPVGGENIALGVPMYWAINSESESAEKQAAKDFLEWLYLSDEGKAIIVDEFYFIPPFTGYDDYPVADSLGQDIMRYQSEGRTTSWVFMGYPTAWGEDVLGVNIQKYIAGQMTWEELIADSATQWEASR